jgi:N-acetylmuramoyl-L-alanine amidase
MNNLPIDKIVIHCSDSPHRNDSAKDIHAWHVERGWSGIGYHYVIDQYGDIEAGRPEYWVGAHVNGHNLHSIGICMIGVKHFTDAQWSALTSLIRDLKQRHNSPAIMGHRDLDLKKSCPNFDVKKWCQEQGL